MPKKLKFRPIIEEERSVNARIVERAKMILWFHDGQLAVDVAEKLHQTLVENLSVSCACQSSF